MDACERLVAAARDVRARAWAPYSRFHVGAALEAADGTIFTGCNVENASYGLTICAERVALFRAIADGHRRFTRLAVVADTVTPTSPCGACRQVLYEFAPDLDVVLANLTGITAHHRLADLLPDAFNGGLLPPTS